MAVNAQAVVNVNVNTQQWNAFVASYQKFNTMLGKNPQQFAQMSASQKAMAQSFQQGVAALMAQNQMLIQNVLLTKTISQHAQATHRSWKDIAKTTREHVKDTVEATRSLIKWGGIITGIVTGMGLYGIGRLGGDVRSTSYNAAGAGMGYGEMQAMRLAYGAKPYADIGGMTSGIAKAREDPASNAAIALSMLQVPTTGSTLQTSFAMRIAAQRQMRESGKTPAEMMRDFGTYYGDVGLNEQMLRADQKAGINSIRKEGEEANKNAGTLGMGEGKQAKWISFMDQVDKTIEHLKHTIVDVLEPLLPGFEKNMQEMLKNFATWAHNGNLKKFIEDLAYALPIIGNGLVWLADKMLAVMNALGKKHGVRNVGAGAGVGGILGLPFGPAGVVVGAAGGGWAGSYVTDKEEEFDALRKKYPNGPPKAWTLREKFDWLFTPAPEKEGSHQDGTTGVRRTGMYQLHQGEAVVPEGMAELMRRSAGYGMEDWKRAISGVESGGRYSAVNSISGASGKYQVMPANIASWTKQALGRSMSVEQFRADPQAQERVFETIFGGYVQRYGNPIDAASVWFSGQPLAGNRSGPDAMGTSVPGYIQKFLAALTGQFSPSLSLNVMDQTGGNVAMSMSNLGYGGILLPAFPV